MDPNTVELTCEGLPEDVRYMAASGIERMNQLSSWQVRVRLPGNDLDLEPLIAAPAALRLTDPEEGTARVACLMVTSVIDLGHDSTGHYYTILLAPQEAVLMQRSGYRVFRDKAVKDIVTEVLADSGIGEDRISWRLSGTYVPRPYCVQYGESEWHFIERLLADEGIAYWFDSDADDAPLVVFADASEAHDSLRENGTLMFDDGEIGTSYRRLFALEMSQQMTTEAVHVREFDVRAPEVPIEGKAGQGPLEHFEYPANVLTGDAADARAQVRLEQLRRRRVELLGQSNCYRMQAGRVVTVEGCADAWHNGNFLVTEVEHTWHFGTRASSEGYGYTNRVTMVPHGEQTYRPLPRRHPSVEGFEPAFTTGPAGEEIHVDDLGRVKVRFPWDRSGVLDDTSSYWVRTFQMQMTGSMLLPRVGWEVPVAYIDGNPDKPMVLGRVYNGNSVVPYGLPGGAATTTLQSATSPGGGSTTEIRMGDSGGSQEMFVHAAKDQTVVVGGAASTDVAVDTTHDVTLTLRNTVNAAQAITVGGSQSVNVGADYGLTIGGGRAETIGGLEHIKVTANRRISSAAYNELIGALYGIQCNQSNTSVKGAFTQLVGGSLSTIGGLSVTETVLAARTELVGGTQSITTAKDTVDSTTGAKIIKAGACSEKAGASVVTTTMVAGRVSVGGSATMSAGGGFAIEAPSITIQAASLSAKALALKGGTLHAKSGTTLVKASTIKRQGGGSLG